MNRLVLFIIVMLSVGIGNAQSWQKLWTVESEASDFAVSQLGIDTLEIRSPKGLTLWYNKKLKGNVTVEYDAEVVVTGKEDRLSDLNCFFMASDPKASSVFTNLSKRGGVFAKQVSLQMYYLGYGGNYNTTTRFRRYTGNGQQPPIITEYTDADHLLKANHWYRIKITKRDGIIRYYVDGQCIVDYKDPSPLNDGWFGFRTTLSRIRIANFKVYDTPKIDIPLHWVGAVPTTPWPISLGIPFAKGEMKDSQLSKLSIGGNPCDTWVNARWQDGSVKWAGLTTVVPTENIQKSQQVLLNAARGINTAIATRKTISQIIVDNGKIKIFFPRHGSALVDSITTIENKRCLGSMSRIVGTTNTDFENVIDTVYVETQSKMRAVVRVDGHGYSSASAMTLPYTLRFYIYNGIMRICLAHTLLYNGDMDKDFISRLGLCFNVPLREANYNRIVALSSDSSMWMEPVQPLVGRRELDKHHDYELDQLHGIKVPDSSQMDEKQKFLIGNWASWNGYRLSQLNDGSFTIRKRATSHSPWIGTFTGHHSNGLAYVGDTDGGIAVSLKDFWQSYPTSLQVDGACSDEAQLTVWLWSPEAEPMDLRHYDDRAHNLEASYEDVQKGLSTPYGIGRTHTLTIIPTTGYPGTESLYDLASTLAADPQLLPPPEYLHDKGAFGIWSLKKPIKDSLVNVVEAQLDKWIDIYKKAQQESHWYGFWNYGDFMHAYDADRKEWRYDVGGYAWDNTELASPDWLWYEFLRTGRSDIYTLALAMTRHNSEVDTYHIGTLKGLGSRHNVSHWGCGAKEARISQAAFSRFAYYLTCDERLGDIMHDEVDVDTILYHLDPMRLAEPRSQYPCNAPARLRIGPDWLAYAGNWMTEWERTGNTYYKNKIETGLRSIAALPNGFFTGNLAKGYDPKTGRITYDGDQSLHFTNHLMTIMGGFEVMNELMEMVNVPSFNKIWLDFANRYKDEATKNHKHFPVRRLEAYAAWKNNDKARAMRTWQNLLKDKDYFSTNDAALWSLDAIYMLEVLPTK